MTAEKQQPERGSKALGGAKVVYEHAQNVMATEGVAESSLLDKLRHQTTIIIVLFGAVSYSVGRLPWDSLSLLMSAGMIMLALTASLCLLRALCIVTSSSLPRRSHLVAVNKLHEILQSDDFDRADEASMYRAFASNACRVIRDNRRYRRKRDRALQSLPRYLTIGLLLTAILAGVSTSFTTNNGAKKMTETASTSHPDPEPQQSPATQQQQDQEPELTTINLVEEPDVTMHSAQRAERYAKDEQSRQRRAD